MTRRRLEAIEQETFFEFVAVKAKQDVRYELIHSTLNGAKLEGGGKEWNKLLKQGAKKGLSDVICYVPSKNYRGFVAEFKSPTGKVSKEQAKWLSIMTILGYAAFIFTSSHIAIQTVERWISCSSFSPQQLALLKKVIRG